MTMDDIDVLIAGAGLAGSRCAETLRAGGFEGSVVVCGDEPHAPYERPALSKELLSGVKVAEDLRLRAPGFWAERDIALRLDAPLDALDLGARTARLGGDLVRWRHLVLATGATPRRIPSVPRAENVHHLRGLDDAAALAADLGRGGRLVIIGSGFVGAEVASSALGLGAAVTIVETLPVPFAATLGQAVGRRLADHYRSCGVDLRLGQGMTAVGLRDGRVVSVTLADGAVLDCSSLLVAVGTRPSAGLVEGLLELAPDGGVPTDAAGATDVPGVFACGDVASPWRHELGRHQRLEHWTAAATGGATVARAIMGLPSPPAPPPYFWSDQFGWRLQMVGHAMPGSDAMIEEREGGFVARYIDATGDVSAALAVNRPADLGALRDEVLATAAAA
jgi:3-phenylpropionate/trans-cinnamate dioxygenase ferredoxin reductase subunit